MASAGRADAVTRYTRRAVPILTSSVALGALLAMLSWPGTRATLAPTAGLDPSWQAALAMAAHHRLDFGTDIIWTYGPFGFLVSRSLYYPIPAALDTTLFTVFSTAFPAYRGFMVLLALLMMAAVYLLLTRTRIGLIIQASLTHPEMVESLGHDVPRVFMLVFGGGCALAALAGVIGGAAFVTEPGMAASVGSIVFVIVVVGGLGSLGGALAASLLIGLLQTFSVASGFRPFDFLGPGAPGSVLYQVAGLKVSQLAPIMPYLLMVVMLIVRPRGLMGTRED